MLGVNEKTASVSGGRIEPTSSTHAGAEEPSINFLPRSFSCRFIL